MVPDEYLNNTFAGWLTWYTNKRNFYKAALMITVTIDVIVVIALPIAYYGDFHLTLKKFLIVAILLFFVLYVTTVKTRQSYLSCKVLVNDLETEKQLYIAGNNPYNNDDKRRAELFEKRTKRIISDSFPVLSNMPEGFSTM